MASTAAGTRPETYHLDDSTNNHFCSVRFETSKDRLTHLDLCMSLRQRAWPSQHDGVPKSIEQVREKKGAQIQLHQPAQSLCVWRER